MKFTKMHGIGNDYVYVNAFEERVEDPVKAAIYLSDRHFGVGSDGLILIKPSDEADCEMEMYNADGSMGEMCGNGIRCVAKYVYERNISKKTTLKVKTGAGIKTLELNVEGDEVVSVKVNMGTPELSCPKVPVIFPKDRMINEPLEVEGVIYNVTTVSVGNPHCVIFMEEDVRKIDLEKIGPKFENHPIFPKRINTEFLNVIDRNHMRMRVWERGSGETLACGTGASASTVAGVINGLIDSEVEIELLGGKLVINYEPKEDIIYMSGPATIVYDGEVTIPKDFQRDDVRIY